jgi:hypothetical protein
MATFMDLFLPVPNVDYLPILRQPESSGHEEAGSVTFPPLPPADIVLGAID